MKDSRKEKTKNALLNAMMTCLETESFDQITASQLAKMAGISRSGFYTHFRDKYDMIDYYQQDLLKNLELVFEKYENDKRQAFLEIATFLQGEKFLSTLIMANGTHDIQSYFVNKIKIVIDNDLIGKFGKKDVSPLAKEYGSVYFAYAFFGILRHWIAKGKQESPEEMTNFIMTILPENLAK